MSLVVSELLKKITKFPFKLLNLLIVFIFYYLFYSRYNYYMYFLFRNNWFFLFSFVFETLLNLNRKYFLSTYWWILFIKISLLTGEIFWWNLKKLQANALQQQLFPHTMNQISFIYSVNNLLKNSLGKYYNLIKLTDLINKQNQKISYADDDFFMNKNIKNKGEKITMFKGSSNFISSTSYSINFLKSKKFVFLVLSMIEISFFFEIL